MTAILLLIAGYLLGSIPFGLVLTRMAGLDDIRTIGSGNIGATNVLRTGRKDLALATLLLDAGKGAIAVGLAILILPHSAHTLLPAMAGAAAFMGHCFPVFLSFKGGKGVATFFGTLFAIEPVIATLGILSWVASAGLIGISSLSALIAAMCAPLFAYFYIADPLWMVLGFMSLMIFIRHHENIGRLVRGVEPRIGANKRA